MEKEPEIEALKYYENAKQILEKAEPDYEIGVYDNIKYVQEAFGTLWLAILKAIDYALLKRGLTPKELPKSSETYGDYIKNYLSHRDGKLQKAFWNLYHQIHIAGYYRGDLRGIETIKDTFQLAKRFIEKLIK